MRRAFGKIAVALILALALARVARADSFADLEWHAPPGCASRDAVLAEVARLVARAPREPLLVRGRVTRERATYRVRLELAGAVEGVRVLQTDSCTSIARATALIVALAIDPQAALVVSEEAMERTQPTEPPDARIGLSSTAHAATADPPEAPLQLVGFVGVVSEHALLPGLALGGEAGAGLAWRFMRGDIAAGFVPRATAALANAPSVGGHFALAHLAARGCAGLVRDAVSALGCVTVRGSRIWANGQGASPSYDEVVHVLSFEPGLLVRIPGGAGIGAELTANLVVPASRPLFVIDGSDAGLALYRVHAVGGIVKMALGFAF